MNANQTKSHLRPLRWTIAGACLAAATVQGQTTQELQTRVQQLEQELANARQQLATAQQQTSAAEQRATVAEAQLAETDQPAEKIQIGPVTIGGAIRANYVNGNYDSANEGRPTRGGSDGGDIALDTFRINIGLDYNQWIGAIEYRWYEGYNFLHTGWLGYDFGDAGTVKVGVVRVPFGPGAYGVSQSWFFDQHYYVGLADDMDLGVLYTKQMGNLTLDAAYYLASEGQWNGASRDSARYSYDAVTYDLGGVETGFEEEHQFNLRAIYSMPDLAVPTDFGVSLQYGLLDGIATEDGEHYAASVHAKSTYRNFTLTSQLSYYNYDIEPGNLWGNSNLIPMGAYDYAALVATEAWLPAVSLSYTYETPNLAWLDYILPYIEYSSIVKTDDAFNDSEMFILGAAFARGGWYVYADYAFSNGNYFVGNSGDFGANADDDWQSRFNINFGYYF
ncbi:MAG: hypothetical protein Q7P63_06235 [Verrucomicrobiota bacterium JB022]|nr:hypothetical protein [Verrucomicrobiota bacterium JB022]